MRRPPVLIRESDRSIQYLLNQALKKGFAPDCVATLREVEDQARHPKHQALVLDVADASDPAMAFLQSLRASGDSRVVVTMSASTARDLPSVCYEAGADGHVHKTGVLGREVRGLLGRLMSRQHGLHPRVDGILLPQEPFVFAGAKINPATMRMEIGDQSLELVPKELAILALFASRKGQLVKRSEVLAHVWGPHANHTSKSLDVYLVRLRKLFEKGDVLLADYVVSKVKVGWWIAEPANDKRAK